MDLISPSDSGRALVERGLINKEWFTLEIILKNKQQIRLVKLGVDDLEEIQGLYSDLKQLMDDWFQFVVDYKKMESGTDC